MNETIKAGWKTTEFWVSLATGVCGLLVTLGVFDAGQAHDIAASVGKLSGGIIMAVSSAAYAISRARTKTSSQPLRGEVK